MIWPFPRLVAGPDPARLPGPMVLATFHIGTPLALGALLERLPGEVLALWNARGLQRPGVTGIDLTSGEEQVRVAAVRRAVQTLRAGGFVATVVDGSGGGQIDTELFGRRFPLPRGTFAIARLGGAPILPVTARWRGRRVEIVTGPLIEPAAEPAMAAALVRWLEAYLTEHPEQMLAPVARLLQTSSLAGGVGGERGGE